MRQTFYAHELGSERNRGEHRRTESEMTMLCTSCASLIASSSNIPSSPDAYKRVSRSTDIATVMRMSSHRLCMLRV